MLNTIAQFFGWVNEEKPPETPENPENSALRCADHVSVPHISTRGKVVIYA